MDRITKGDCCFIVGLRTENWGAFVLLSNVVTQ